MADPVSLGAVAAGGVIKAFGSIMGGEAQSDMYNYQASVAAVNKKIADQNADYAIRTGEVTAQREGMKGRYEFGAMKTARASSGFDVNTGSNAKLLESKEAINSYNQSLIRSNAAKQAYGYKVEAMNASAQSQIYKMAASNSETQGIIGGIGSLVGTAGSVADKWIAGTQAGLLGGSSGGNTTGFNYSNASGLY